MTRADGARNNSTDEIPLAQRSGPKRLNLWEPGLKKFFLLFLGGLILVAFVQPNTFSRLAFLIFDGDQISKPSTDGRLLGHFPYPEAQIKDLVEVSPGLKLHTDAAKALVRMRAAAASDGIQLSLLSGFRSHSLQKGIFFDLKSVRNQTANERARVSAPPGYSEHSTGYAIDLGDATRPDTDFLENFESTQAFKWLKANTARYHFRLSFPPNNFQRVSYEPWHWRFEGTAEALRQFSDAQRLGNRFNKL